MHQLLVAGVCADGGRGEVEDSAVVKILEVTRPIPGPLLAQDPGVAILCNQRNADYTSPRILFVQRLRCHHAVVISISRGNVCNARCSPSLRDSIYIRLRIYIYLKIFRCIVYIET